MADNNIFDDSTPLDELMDEPTPMDDPTPMDEPTQEGDEDFDDEEYEDDENQDDAFIGRTISLKEYNVIVSNLIRKGEDGHADIYKVRNAPDGMTLVWKLYQPGRMPKDTNALFFIQEASMKDIDSFHLVPLYEYGWYEDEQIAEKRFYELLKYMEGGSLDGLPSNTDFNTMKTIVESAAQALYVLHKGLQVKHADIKISNLFLSDLENGRILLGDYDHAELIGDNAWQEPDQYESDWKQLKDMTKRFKVSTEPDFQSIIDEIEDTTPTLPLEDITLIANIYAYVMSLYKGEVGFESTVIVNLLSDSGYNKQQEWVENCCYSTATIHEDGTMTTVHPSGNGGCAPYSKFTAGWKAVYGLMGENNPPEFYGLRSLDDVRKASRDKLLDYLHNNLLKDWLAIFFHENPWKDFSRQYTYEREVERYLEFIRELDPDDENVMRFDAARDSILSGTKSFTNWKWGIWFTQAVCGLFYAIPALLLIGWLIFKGMPFDANPMTPTFATGSLAVGAIVAVALFFIFNDDTFSSGCGCLVSAFVGAVIMLLLMWGLVSIMDSLLPFIPWVIVALMLGLSVLVYFMIFSDDLKGASVNPQSDPDMWLVQPLYYAFDTSQQGYIYRQASDYYDLSNQFRSGLKKMVLMMALPILVAWGLWLGYKSITPDLGGTKLTTVQDRLDNMAGDWTGTFGEKKATMQVLCTHRDSFKIALTLEAQQPVTQTFTGELDGLLDVDLENDTPDDDILDGSVELSINYKSDSVLYGKFRDNLTEKKTNISFKKEKEENDSVQ